MASSKIIEKYIADEKRLKGGHFLLYDPLLQQALELNYDAVQVVQKLGHRQQMACVSMTSPEGLHYDVDFLVQNTGRKPSVREITIHEVNGIPRMEWIREERSLKN